MVKSVHVYLIGGQRFVAIAEWAFNICWPRITGSADCARYFAKLVAISASYPLLPPRSLAVPTGIFALIIVTAQAIPFTATLDTLVLNFGCHDYSGRTSYSFIKLLTYPSSLIGVHDLASLRTSVIRQKMSCQVCVQWARPVDVQ
jgi:hypothetical protein